MLKTLSAIKASDVDRELPKDSVWWRILVVSLEQEHFADPPAVAKMIWKGWL